MECKVAPNSNTRCSLFDNAKIRVEHKLCINIVITGRCCVRKGFQQYLFLVIVSHRVESVYNAYNVCKNIARENWQSFSFNRQVRQTCLFIVHKIRSNRFIHSTYVCTFEIYIDLGSFSTFFFHHCDTKNRWRGRRRTTTMIMKAFNIYTHTHYNS